MKNGLLVLNLILLAAVGFLFFRQFSTNNKKGSNSNSAQNGTMDASAFRIAYFEMDSIEANFAMVKQVMSELNKKEQDMIVEMDKMGKEIQRKYDYYQGLAEVGNLSQTQSEQAGQEIKSLDEKMRTRKQQLDQDYYDLKTRKQNEIKSKIETFLKEYNKEKGYSYIISYEPGLFYYKDTLYNITADVVKGLNELYGKKKGN